MNEKLNKKKWNENENENEMNKTHEPLAYCKCCDDFSLFRRELI